MREAWENKNKTPQETNTTPEWWQRSLEPRERLRLVGLKVRVGQVLGQVCNISVRSELFYEEVKVC